MGSQYVVHNKGLSICLIREVPSSSRAQQMLNNSSRKPQIIFPILTISTKWACDPENINIHYGVGASGDAIVEPTLAPGALSIMSDIAAAPLTN